ncbi:MAG: hypothetical protein JXB46_10000 [Candidatus Eisenbacteria bacterium]|nr:hypothetical protein [Candidatus Eisenbacteria bacterium]
MSAGMPCELRRHYTKLSAKDTEDVISRIADLIVSLIRQRGGLARPVPSEVGEGARAPVTTGVGGQTTDE